MKKLLFLAGIVALFSPAAFGATIYVKASPPTQTQCVVNGTTTTCYPQRISAPIVKVAQLASYPYAGAWAAVTDGNSSTDCTVGGGSTVVFCLYSGSSWSAVGGSGGGNVTGPGSSTANDIAVFGDTSGQLLADGGGPLPANTTATTHQFFTAYTKSTGAFTKAQPACADLSNSAASCSTDATNASNITTGTLPATQLPTPTATAAGGTTANTFYQTAFAVNSLTTTFTQNQIRLFPVYIPTPQVWSTIIYAIGVADNTANAYDIGAYGPGCLGGAANIPLIIHSGSTAGTSFAPSTGLKSIAASASNVAIPQGWYCVAITSSGGTPAAVLGGQTTGNWTPWSPTNISGGGATLPSTITAPATSPATTQGIPNFGGAK